VKNKALILSVLVSAIILSVGWGVVGHKLINRKTPQFFPPQMNAFLYWTDSLAAHGSDADYRKSTDPNESPRHYIDIDNYPEFIANGRIPQDFDSLVALHGLYFVLDQGIVPFSVIATVDSVKQAFIQHNWQKAMLKSADLGHYVGDSHNPLHLTKWYDGWSNFSNGIHSRYETGLISRDSAFIQYLGDSIQFVSNINTFVFDYVYANYRYVDSVYRCDSIAHVIAGNTSSTLYYQEFWNRAGNFTILLFKNASRALARLIYTAWVNAGSPLPTGIQPIAGEVKNYNLYQNYPNPFNPATKIKFEIAPLMSKIPIQSGRGVGEALGVSLKVYNMLGKEITTLVNEQLQPGIYEVTFDGSNLSSGIYFYQLRAGEFIDTKKFVLLK